MLKWRSTRDLCAALRAALLVGLVVATDASADPAFAGPSLVMTAGALAGPVERLAVRTKPADWQARRSCLYYALAGQYLLARAGIDARLRVGQVVFAPGTAAAHRIRPHAWLETPTHFIDYATLPRWGMVVIIPRSRVAYSPADIQRGRTGVLVRHRPPDADLLSHLAEHRTRFNRGLRLLHAR